MTTTTHGPSIIFTTKLEKNVTQWAPIYWTEDLDRTPTTLGRDPIKLPSDLSRDPVHVWVDALKKLERV